MQPAEAPPELYRSHYSPLQIVERPDRRAGSTSSLTLRQPLPPSSVTRKSTTPVRRTGLFEQLNVTPSTDGVNSRLPARHVSERRRVDASDHIVLDQRRDPVERA